MYECMEMTAINGRYPSEYHGVKEFKELFA